jgi:hypothetical protein
MRIDWFSGGFPGCCIVAISFSNFHLGVCYDLLCMKSGAEKGALGRRHFRVMYELYGKLRTLLLGVCQKTNSTVEAEIGELDEYMDTEAHNVMLLLLLLSCACTFAIFSLR